MKHTALLSLCVAVLSLGFTACVSTQKVPLSSEQTSSLRGQTVVASQHAKPTFAAVTPGKAAFGMVGAAAMIAEGNAQIRNNQVPDPAERIGHELAAALASKLGMRVVPDGGRITSGDQAATVAREHPEARYVVDVRTINWSCAYYPFGWASYRVIYSAKLRLIDTQTAAVLCEGFFARVPDDQSQAFSYDGLMSNNAAGLKAELGKAAQEAIVFFKGEILKL
jgi:hypothetical protein